MNIVIKLDTERQAVMTVHDAKRIYAELHKMFGENKAVPLPDSEPDWVKLLRGGYKGHNYLDVGCG